MIRDGSNSPAKDNPLVRALARWEWEGGSLGRDRERYAEAIQEEDHILHCLGAAVIMRWTDLPMEVQRELFKSAVSVTDPLPKDELRQHLARFLHTYKDAKALEFRQ